MKEKIVISLITCLLILNSLNIMGQTETSVNPDKLVPVLRIRISFVIGTHAGQIEQLAPFFRCSPRPELKECVYNFWIGLF